LIEEPAKILFAAETMSGAFESLAMTGSTVPKIFLSYARKEDAE